MIKSKFEMKMCNYGSIDQKSVYLLEYGSQESEDIQTGHGHGGSKTILFW